MIYTQARGVQGIRPPANYRVDNGAQRGIRPIRLSALAVPRMALVRKRRDGQPYFFVLPLIGLLILLIAGPLRLKSSAPRTHAPSYTTIPLEIASLSPGATSSQNGPSSSTSNGSSGVANTQNSTATPSSSTTVGGRGGGPDPSTSTTSTSTPGVVLSPSAPSTQPLAGASTDTTLTAAGQTLQISTDPSISNSLSNL
jgi:hypothetical protein